MLDDAKPADHTTCCPADPRIARHFDRSMRRQAEGGKLPPMAGATRALLGLLEDTAQLRPTLLELGCGPGALTVELLSRGAARADGVDLSAESLAVARQRADEAGVGERATFTLGDGAQVSLTQHDWVVLDRVICCYRHVEQLLANAVPAAGRRFAFTVPIDHGWRGLLIRLVLAVEVATTRLRGNPCPGYQHDIGRIEQRLAEAGFRRLRHRTAGLWYAAVFERPAAASAPMTTAV
jgi:magnesium-protoporphyrin O-methyltransferase